MLYQAGLNEQEIKSQHLISYQFSQTLYVHCYTPCVNGINEIGDIINPFASIFSVISFVI